MPEQLTNTAKLTLLLFFGYIRPYFSFLMQKLMSKTNTPAVHTNLLQKDKLVNIPELDWLDGLTSLMDNRLRIPFTNIRFGVDALLTFLPVAGEVVSFGISGVMVLAMARHGVSGMVILKMIFNIFLDAIVGAIPVLGFFFNVGYKANVRNIRLLEEHYEEGMHQGSGLKIVLTVVVALTLCVLLLLYGLYKFAAFMWGLLTAVGV